MLTSKTAIIIIISLDFVNETVLNGYTVAEQLSKEKKLKMLKMSSVDLLIRDMYVCTLVCCLLAGLSTVIRSVGIK